MTITDEAPSPLASGDAEALFPEARRRRLRIRITIGAGGLLLVAAVVIPLVWVSGWVGRGSLAPGSSPSAITSADVLARNPPDALLVWDGANETRLGAFEVGDPTNGRVRSIPGPPGHYSCLLACIARRRLGAVRGLSRRGLPTGLALGCSDADRRRAARVPVSFEVRTVCGHHGPGSSGWDGVPPLEQRHRGRRSVDRTQRVRVDLPTSLHGIGHRGPQGDRPSYWPERLADRLADLRHLEPEDRLHRSRVGPRRLVDRHHDS